MIKMQESDLIYNVMRKAEKSFVREMQFLKAIKMENEEGNNVVVPLEKNALYLYNGSGIDDNSLMYYDIYLCVKAGTVPLKLVSSADFILNYNTIEDISIRVVNGVDDEDDEIYLEIYVRDADKLCTASDVERIIQEYMNS